MRLKIVAVAAACCLPALAHGRDTIRRSFPSNQTQQEIIAESTRMEPGGSSSYEGVRRSQMLKRKEQDRQKLRIDDSEQSGSRPAAGFSRGASRVQRNIYSP